MNWDTVIRAIALEFADVAGPFLLCPRPPDPRRMEAVSRQIVDRGEGAQRAGHGRCLRRAEPGHAGGRARFSPTTTCCSRPPSAGFPPRTARCATTNPATPRPVGCTTLFDYGPFTAVFNISGNPAISLPLGQSSSGLPIGVQLIAAYGREDLLIQIAAHLEQAMPWKPCTTQWRSNRANSSCPRGDIESRAGPP